MWIRFDKQMPMAFDRDCVFNAMVTEKLMLTDGEGEYWSDKVIINNSGSGYHSQGHRLIPVAWMKIPEYEMDNESQENHVLNDRVKQLSEIGFVYHETSTSYFNHAICTGIQKDKVLKMSDAEFEEKMFLFTKRFAQHIDTEYEKAKKYYVK